MVNVRRLTGNDAQEYLALWQDARGRPAFSSGPEGEGSPEAWLDGLAIDADYFVLGAFAQVGQLVGVASLVRRLHPRWRHRATLQQVHTARDSAEDLTALLTAAVAVAEGLGGVRQVELVADRDDVRLVGVARRVGFDYCDDPPGLVQFDSRSYDPPLMVLRLGGAAAR
jgi:hypothetical protein